MSDYQTVLSAASELAIADRLRLIDALSASVPDDQPPTLSEEWIRAINHRSDELDRGDVQAVSWETVRQDLRRRVGLDGTN